MAPGLGTGTKRRLSADGCAEKFSGDKKEGGHQLRESAGRAWWVEGRRAASLGGHHGHPSPALLMLPSLLCHTHCQGSCDVTQTPGEDAEADWPVTLGWGLTKPWKQEDGMVGKGLGADQVGDHGKGRGQGLGSECWSQGLQPFWGNKDQIRGLEQSGPSA